MHSHLIGMLVLALATGTVFSFSMREGSMKRVRFALGVAGVMMAVALLVGWLMYPFPR